MTTLYSSVNIILSGTTQIAINGTSGDVVMGNTAGSTSIASVLTVAPGSITNPTVALVYNGAGVGVLTGNYRWAYTFYNAVGETLLSPVTGKMIFEACLIVSGSVTLTGHFAVLTIPLSLQPVIGRRLYRTLAGGSTYFKVFDIANNNSTAQANDNVADGSLGVQAPTSNSTTASFLTSSAPTTLLSGIYHVVFVKLCRTYRYQL